MTVQTLADNDNKRRYANVDRRETTGLQLTQRNNHSLRIAVNGRGSIHQGNAHQLVIK